MNSRKFFLISTAMYVATMIFLAIAFENSNKLWAETKYSLPYELMDRDQVTFLKISGILWASQFLVQMFLLGTVASGAINIRFRWALATATITTSSVILVFMTTMNPLVILGVMTGVCFILRGLSDLPKSELEGMAKTSQDKAA